MQEIIIIIIATQGRVVYGERRHAEPPGGNDYPQLLMTTRSCGEAPLITRTGSFTQPGRSPPPFILLPRLGRSSVGINTQVATPQRLIKRQITAQGKSQVQQNATCQNFWRLIFIKCLTEMASHKLPTDWNPLNLFILFIYIYCDPGKGGQWRKTPR